MVEEGQPLVNLSEENASWNKLALEISRERLSIVVPKAEPRSEPTQKESSKESK
jgi:hypothetical protein